MPAKKEVKYIVVTPFDFKRWYEPTAKHYELGVEFIPGDGLTRDPDFDEFRKTGKKKKSGGITFFEVGDVASGDPKDRNDPKAERNEYRYTLPLEEA